MNTATDAQIRKAYEEEHMLPAQIAEDLGFAEVAVKAKLMEVSGKYRKDCGKEPLDEDDLNFTDQQLRAVNNAMYEDAFSATFPDGSPDYKTRQRIREYIRDDKKGRRDVKKVVQNNHFNILESFNLAKAQAQLQAQEARKKLIDV